jgi:hypothetical protein
MKIKNFNQIKKINLNILLITENQRLLKIKDFHNYKNCKAIFGNFHNYKNQRLLKIKEFW